MAKKKVKKKLRKKRMTKALVKKKFKDMTKEEKEIVNKWLGRKKRARQKKIPETPLWVILGTAIFVFVVVMLAMVL